MNGDADDLGFVHRFVPAARPIATTLLTLHGTGGDEDDLLDLGAALLPGAALLSPRGNVSENGMPRFFRRLAEGVFDEPDLIARTHELADFVRAAAERYAFDAANVVAVGYSNGANIAAGTLLLRPDILAGAVLLRPMVPLVPENLPDLAGTPVFVASGRRDPIAPPENAARLVALLHSAGANVTHHESDAAHGLTMPDIETAGRWLREHF
jgi:predicted esterase